MSRIKAWLQENQHAISAVIIRAIIQRMPANVLWIGLEIGAEPVC